MERNIYKIGKELFITSDEEIKEGDWYLTTENTIHKKGNDKNRMYVGGTNGINKKIILTTDQDLIKDGVQSIDDEFLEWFVKNPTCEYISVENVPDFIYETNHSCYKIITPKEGPNQGNNFYEGLKHYFETTPREKVLEDWNKSAEFDKVAPTIEEFLEYPEQETLELSAKKYSELIPFVSDIVTDNSKLDFIAGAKWQAERMYNEKEVKNMLTDMSNFINTKELKDVSDSTTYEWHRKRDWFASYLIEIIEKNKKK